MTAEQAPLIAIVNEDKGVVELFEMLLRLEGYRIVAAQPGAVEGGAEALVRFLADHDPDVVLFDVPYPYHESWQIFQRVRRAGALRGGAYVLTTTNERAVRQQAGPAAPEIVELPFESAVLLRAIRWALGSEPEPAA